MIRLLALPILLLTLCTASTPATAQDSIPNTDTTELLRLRPEGSLLQLEVAGYGITLGKHDAPSDNGARTASTATPTRRLRVGAGLVSLELGYSTLIGTRYGAKWSGYGDFLETSTPKSIHFAYEFLKLRYMLDRTAHWWLSLSCRAAFDDYGFSNPITLRRTNGIIVPVEIDPAPRKSKLSVGYLGFPLRLTFSPARKLNISLRATGEIRIGSHTKYKKPKVKDDITGLAPWRWTVGGMITYHKIGLYAEYCITPLFKPGVGPETHGLSLGLYLGF